MEPFFWWLFLAMIFLVGVLFQVYLLAAAAVMLAIVGALSTWWQRRSLTGVIYQRRPYYRRAFPGETVTIRTEVENRKFLPLSWLRVLDPWPTAVGPQDESLLFPTENPERGLLVNLYSLRWYERARRTYTLLFRKRGVYALGPARLETGDLFGMFEKVREDGPVDYLTVMPEPLPFHDLRLPAEDPFGDRRARRRLYEDPTQPMGIRDYHPEDDFRHVHWPATARTGSLQVKVYQPVSSRVLVVCLNVSTLQFSWQGTNPPLLEYLVRVAAALAQHAIQDGYRVGLVSNGCLAHADQPFRVPPGRSPSQLIRLLETLAGVTPFVTGAFDRFMGAEMSRLPYGATLVIVTALITPVLAETLLRIRKHGHRVTVLYFGKPAPPDIAGVQLVHLPFEGNGRA